MSNRAAGGGEGKARHAPSMFDVAELAGVSHQTVSRVVNGSAQVSPQTRAKVLAAIETTGFRPNLAARALVTKQSRLIGMVVANSHLLGPASTMFGVERAAREAGYWAAATALPAPTPAEVASAIGHFADLNVDGLVMIVPNQLAYDALNAHRKNATSLATIPLVAVTSTKDSFPGLVAVDSNQAAGAAQVMEHLLKLGHRSIAHISGPAGDFHAERRKEVWQAALTAAGLPAGPLAVGDWTGQAGYSLAKRILKAKHRPTAIFAANDSMAIGALRAAHDLGAKVPDDVSVAGFDNSPGTDQTIPPLTTVTQDFDAVGSATMEALLGLMRGETNQVANPVPQLVVRASTAPPA